MSIFITGPLNFWHKVVVHVPDCVDHVHNYVLSGYRLGSNGIWPWPR